jgi:hypothetical protein
VSALAVRSDRQNVTRFRMFGGRHETRQPGEPTAAHPGAPFRSRPAGAWPTPPASSDPAARHRARSATPTRTGVRAAAVAGGALALAGPAVAITAQPATPAAQSPTVLQRLTADAAARTSVLPAVDGLDVLPPGLEVARVVKAAGLAEAAERAEVAQRAELRATARASTDRCHADLDGLGALKPWARTGTRFLSCLYDEPELDGVGGRADKSDEPGGLAVDFVVRGQRGERIAECALANREELGVDYVLWRQRANYGDGWERLSDRDGDDDQDTAGDDRDRVRIAFERRAPGRDDPLARRCR